MDMTGWLEYYVEGLTTQLAEVRQRGEQAIRRDLLVKQYGLSDRQGRAIKHILEHGSLPSRSSKTYVRTSTAGRCSGI